MTRKIFVDPPEPFPPNAVSNLTGHLVVGTGDEFKSKRSKKTYRVLNLLSFGSFCEVYHVVELEFGIEFAMKVSIANQLVYPHARNEVVRYAQLQNYNPADDLNGFVRMVDSWEHFGHLILILELCSSSVRQLLLQRGNQGFSLVYVQAFLKHIISPLMMLHSMGYPHADLKPDNILFSTSGKPKLIDLGASTYLGFEFDCSVQSRYYRAPEVFLKQRITPAIDVWSLGCVALEFFLGVPLFPGSGSVQMLKLFEHLLGKIPSILTCNSQTDFFDDDGNVKTDELEDVFQMKAHNLPDLIKLMNEEFIYDVPREMRQSEHEFCQKFIDLARSMLEYIPEKRITLQEIRNHDFLHFVVG